MIPANFADTAPFVKLVLQSAVETLVQNHKMRGIAHGPPAKIDRFLHTAANSEIQKRINKQLTQVAHARENPQGWLGSQEQASGSSQKSTFLFSRLTLGRGPAAKNESDLVDKVCNVVDHVEEGLVHGSKQVAEQVAKRVDGPAKCDNHAHVIEGSGNSLADLTKRATSFTSEDFKEDEGPC